MADDASREDFLPLEVPTPRGLVHLRSTVPHPVSQSERVPGEGAATGAGVVMVGGVGGGWDSPARGLYPRLAAELADLGLHALRVRYRNSTDLDEAVFDVREGIRYLRASGVARIGLVGHSFGGAVVVRAAAAEPDVRTVVTLATQAHGVAPASGFDERCSLLAVHGAQDRVLPAACSVHLVETTGGPHQLIVLEGADHGLDERADDVHDEVLAWLTNELGLDPQPTDAWERTAS